MRVLFVSLFFPENLRTCTQGIYKRMGLFIDALKNLAELDILFYVPPHITPSPSDLDRLQAEFSHHWQIPKLRLFLCPLAPDRSKWQTQLLGTFSLFGQYPYTSQPQQIQAFEQCLDRHPDLIFIHRLPSFCPALLSQQPLPPIVFDLDDIEHIKLTRQIQQPPTRLRTNLYYLHIPALRQGEYRAIRATHTTYICSEHDRAYLANHGLHNIQVIPNAISIPPPQALPSTPSLLLLGGYYYYPNLNAANFLIEQVFPIVRQAIPNAQLIIAGPQPDLIRSYDSPSPGVEFTGFVDDLTALYARSRVVCCPIFSGGGTRVKMVEAAAYGKPIVATAIGAEGLNMKDGIDFLLRNDAQGFADACIELLQNNKQCQVLGHNARNAAIQNYDRDRIIQTIQASVSSIVDFSIQPSVSRHECTV